MYDVLIVGGGVAGLAASIFTARAGLETLVVDGRRPNAPAEDRSRDGESILARNASLENYPGLPAGFDARRYLQLTREQATDAGASFEPGRVTSVDPSGDGFVVSTDAGESFETQRVVAASWPDSSYLDSLEVEREQRGSKHVVDVDAAGRTAVDGVYAAGRIAGEPHQAIVAAGHGSKVALAVVHDADVPFYHDWIAPEGYFTGRDREVPPGCAEIDDDERRTRDERARETMRDRLAEPLDATPTMHPSVDDDA